MLEPEAVNDVEKVDALASARAGVSVVSRFSVPRM